MDRRATAGQTVPVVALTGHDGHTVWMTTDGRVWHGQLPLHGDRFNATLRGHMSDGARFPDGMNHGTAEMAIEHHSASTLNGHHSGIGGCVFMGTVTVPDPRHNLYSVGAHASSCGTLDGDYAGMGTLLDAAAHGGRAP